jgi:hypothetical protein
MSPAISAAIVAGDQPAWFSQRSCPVIGPLRARKSAALRILAMLRGSVRPSCHARTSGSATWSICSSVHTSLPSTPEFCGYEPSGFCWRNSRKSSERSAAARSPAASCAEATW